MNSGRSLLRLELRALLLDPESNAPVVVLEEPQSGLYLPIWIGPFEALAISRALERAQPERPQTHELLVGVFEGLGARLHSALIRGIEGGTFLGALRLEQAGGDLIEVDARPSDAIAIAMRVGAPILAVPEVLERGRSVTVIDDEDDEDRLRRLLESLEPDDFGGYTM